MLYEVITEGEGGPDNWAKIDPRNKLCATGQRQSPIDIRDGIKVDLEPIQFDYRPSTFRIVDNGHTVQVDVITSYSIHYTKLYERRMAGSVRGGPARRRSS